MTQTSNIADNMEILHLSGEDISPLKSEAWKVVPDYHSAAKPEDVKSWQLFVIHTKPGDSDNWVHFWVFMELNNGKKTKDIKGFNLVKDEDREASREAYRQYAAVAKTQHAARTEEDIHKVRELHHQCRVDVSTGQG